MHKMPRALNVDQIVRQVDTYDARAYLTELGYRMVFKEVVALLEGLTSKWKMKILTWPNGVIGFDLLEAGQTMSVKMIVDAYRHGLLYYELYSDRMGKF